MQFRYPGLCRISNNTDVYLRSNNCVRFSRPKVENHKERSREIRYIVFSVKR